MRGIADRAGVSPGTIYLSMPLKDHPLFELHDETVIRIEQRATEAVVGVRSRRSTGWPPRRSGRRSPPTPP